jgi:prepilin-type processing-associated H-X9-DG protein/prepilin-type N-terminal cleavage/methylation domain-containing protein
MKPTGIQITGISFVGPLFAPGVGAWRARDGDSDRILPENRLGDCVPTDDGLGERHYSRKAFSLIEILVVIGVIGVLVILAMPVYNKTIAKAGAAHCAGNLRQIGAGFFQYLSDHGELPYYVDSITRWVDGSEDPRSFFAGPYLDARARDPNRGSTISPLRGIFDCPTMKSKTPRWVGFNYAYNITLTGRRPGSFSHPSRTVLAVEGGDYTRIKAKYSSSPKYYPNGASNPGGTAWDGPNLPISYPHNLRGNFLFLDGHVGVHQQEDLTERWFDGKWAQ